MRMTKIVALLILVMLTASYPGQEAAPPSEAQFAEAPNEPLENRSFWRISSTYPYQTNAGLIGLSATAAWYIEEDLVRSGANYSSEAMSTIMDAFEGVVVTRLHSAFGYEPVPPDDIDGDPRTTILITADLSTFDRRNELPASLEPLSNEREMIYVQYEVDSDALLSVVAHEFTHLIQWNADPKEPGWINEGLAQVAERIVGYDTGDPPYFLADTSVGIWGGLYHWQASYGAWEMFVQYLADRFGGWNFTRELTQNPMQGVAGVEDTLRNLGHEVTFRAVFRDWIVTNLINDVTSEGNRFRYTNLTGRASVPYVAEGDSWSTNVSIENGGATYVRLPITSMTPGYRVAISGVTSESMIAVLVVQEPSRLRLLDARVVSPLDLAVDTVPLSENGNITLAVAYLNASGFSAVSLSIHVAKAPASHTSYLPHAVVGLLTVGAVAAILVFRRRRKRTTNP